jgi:hypothetical protein
MDLTPHLKLMDRRDTYLARISIFDSFECSPEFDARPALVRRFLSGGDDARPQDITQGQAWPFSRPDLATNDNAFYRRHVHDNIDKHEDNRSDDSDYDQFILQSFVTPQGFRDVGQTDLNRITALLARSVELFKLGTALAPDHIFDLRASEVPLPSDRTDAMSRAWALLILAGYKEFDLRQTLSTTLDAADWTADPWQNDAAFVKLRDRVEADTFAALYSFFGEHPSWFPTCPPQPPPPPPSPGSSPPKQPPPAPKQPDSSNGLPPDVTAAILQGDHMLRFAFGDTRGETIVEDLRAIPLKDDLIIRLLVWLDASTKETRKVLDVVSGLTELFPRDVGNTQPQADYYDASGVHYVGEEASLKRWASVKAVILLLRLLGRLNQTTVREACLRLDCVTRLTLNTDAKVLEHLVEEDVDSWPRIVAENSLYTTNWMWYEGWLTSTSWIRSRDDFAFLLVLSVTDYNTFSLLWPNLIGLDRADHLYTPPEKPLPIDAFYWRFVVRDSTFLHILSWKETADFKVADHLRFLGLFRPGGRLRPLKRDDSFERWIQGVVPGWFTELAISALLRFKYWVTDRSTSRHDEEEMTFWSENHQALFASAEFIAGQWFPEATFRAATQLGKWHKERAAERLEGWLHDRLRFGFAELNSPVYYEEHLQAIFNVVDFVEDERLRKLAVMVLDLMIFDVARRNCRGSFMAASTRVYGDKKSSGWAVSIRDFVEVLTGTIGDIAWTNDAAAIYLATSSYLSEIPECLLVIAAERSVPFVDRSRVSISFDDAEKYGIGLESGSDMVFWWGHSAFFTNKTYRLSQAWSERWHLQKTGPFKLFQYVDSFGLRVIHVLGEGVELLALRNLFAVFAGFFPALGIFLYPRMLRFFFDVGSVFLDFISSYANSVGKAFGLLDMNDDRVRLAKTMIEQQVEEAAIDLNAGSVNERIHFYMWRSEDAMLSSLINEKRGKTSAQKETSIATLGMNVSVFVNKPPVIPGATLLSIAAAAGEGSAENLEVWKTIPGALGMGGDPAPENTNLIYTVVVPEAKEDILADGPYFWAGQVSNPLVWQNENVSISIYKPDGHQQDLSDFTHAHWPWDHFDETSTREASGGRWVFGRRDRRSVPRTPLAPDSESRPSEKKPWPDKSRRDVSGEGSGYIALFSAGGMRTIPADNRNWGHKELICDGHNNVWITVVGDRATYGTFNDFFNDVVAAKLNVNRSDGECSITMPDPGSAATNKPGDLFEVYWDAKLVAPTAAMAPLAALAPAEVAAAGLASNAKLAGKDLFHNDWPRFELKGSKLKEGAEPRFGIKNRSGDGAVEFDDTFWRIEAKIDREKDGNHEDVTLFLEHDFTDIKNPRREFNQLPDVKTGVADLHQPAPSVVGAGAKAAQSTLGKAFRGRRRFGT